MGFLKKFFRSVIESGGKPNSARNFKQLSEDQLNDHLSVSVYGEFALTEAIRPSYGLEIVPRQGYRHDVYRDEEGRCDVPVIMASASREILFEVFLDLLNPLGHEVDVVLETSHRNKSRGHTDLYREQIDLPVLKSTLCDYEDLIMNDGCTGVAILNPAAPLEVQFDEHKLLIVYGEDLGDFEHILQSHCVPCYDDMRFITEAEHVHSSSENYFNLFEELKNRLGMDTQEAQFA